MNPLAKALLLAGLITVAIFTIIFWIIPVMVFVVIAGIIYAVLKEKQLEQTGRDITPVDDQ